jgi:hypothetical protein
MQNSESMKKREVKKDDGRYLIYYEFDEPEREKRKDEEPPASKLEERWRASEF